jgi:hypothetical protein
MSGRPEADLRWHEKPRRRHLLANHRTPPLCTSFPAVRLDRQVWHSIDKRLGCCGTPPGQRQSCSLGQPPVPSARMCLRSLGRLLSSSQSGLYPSRCCDQVETGLAVPTYQRWRGCFRFYSLFPSVSTPAGTPYSTLWRMSSRLIPVQTWEQPRTIQGFD